MRPKKAYVQFIKIIEKHFEINKAIKVLDIACGAGHLLGLLEEKKCVTSGVDISDEAVKVAQKNTLKSRIVQGSAEQLPFSENSFQLITCLGSLEHFTDPSKALSEMKRVGDESALFCIVVPNKDYFMYLLLKEEGTSQQEIGETLLSKNEWSEVFVKNGFDVVGVEPDNWIKNNTHIEFKNGFSSFFKTLTKWLAWRVLPIRYTYQFVFLLKKSK